MTHLDSEFSGRPAFLRSCGMAVVLVAAALALTFPLRAIPPASDYFLFYAAVAASAWLGGKWVGWLAVGLSTLAIYYLFLPPPFTWRLDPQGVPLFIECATFAIAASWLSSRRRQAEVQLKQARDELQSRVEERTAELQLMNKRLLAEMAHRKRAEDAYHSAQADLARATRMSTMSALAASIAHEVNQPLAAAVTNADACVMWLRSAPPNVPQALEAAACAAREGTRASDVIRHIRAIFTKAPPPREKIRMNELIGEVVALMNVEASRNEVVVRTELAPDLPAVIGDRVQLQQVLVNLVLNGIEALSGVRDRPRLLVIRSENQQPEAVLIAVRDSGMGIDPRDEKRLFDTFFTSKPNGMGMGLSISRSIVEVHGGRLWASANEDCGATVQFILPLERDSAA
jgi:C4-dicarboxylate-specific signal transduction histidine kinase